MAAPLTRRTASCSVALHPGGRSSRDRSSGRRCRPSRAWRASCKRLSSCPDGHQKGAQPEHRDPVHMPCVTRICLTGPGAFHRQIHLPRPLRDGADGRHCHAAWPPHGSFRHGFTHQRCARPGSEPIIHRCPRATCRLPASTTESSLSTPPNGPNLGVVKRRYRRAPSGRLLAEHVQPSYPRPGVA